MGQQLIPLSDEDREILTQKRTAAVTRMLAFGIATLLILSALVWFHSFFWVLVILSVGFMTGMPAVLFWYARGLLSKDLRLGQKQMLSGPVEAQNVDVTRTTDDDGYESDARPTGFGFRSPARRSRSARISTTNSRKAIWLRRSWPRIREMFSV